MTKTNRLTDPRWQYKPRSSKRAPDWVNEERYDKLARYEDMEEQGRLVVLPCRVGEGLYHVICKQNGGKPFRYIQFSELMPSNLLRVVEEFGKTYFLTRAEAEAALSGEQL